jgi:hypothetical protein
MNISALSPDPTAITGLIRAFVFSPRGAIPPTDCGIDFDEFRRALIHEVEKRNECGLTDGPPTDPGWSIGIIPPNLGGIAPGAVALVIVRNPYRLPEDPAALWAAAPPGTVLLWLAFGPPHARWTHVCSLTRP